ncbi:MAG: aminodeoxychorismate synthase component I [Acidobacteriota bacterium]
MRHPIEGLVLLDDGSRWMRLTDPVAVIETDRPEDVQATIRDVQAQVRARGCHALGFLRYEAGEAFGLTVRRAAPAADALPLVWFALFDAASARAVAPPQADTPYRLGPLAASVSRDAFLDAVRTIRRRLASGDTYQVNCTFRLRATFEGDPRSLFADLVATQRGRYGAFIRAGRYAICSASPELFFALDGEAITARPMKGTVARGRTVAEDREHVERLARSPKEQAENVMVVDMVRNDIGRVARVGTVAVPELFTTERYPNVWQMTSTVTGRTAAPLDEVVAALFPSASVTGAPKVRTMQIIAEIEREPRGVYTGAIGHIGPDGAAQFNVAIRTAVVDCEAGTLEFGVGSGVVWDSDPGQEYDECLLKGSILGQRPRPFELLETVRWTPDEGFALLDRHLARMEASAGYFGFRWPGGELETALDREVRGSAAPRRVRLLVAEDGAVRTESVGLDPERLDPGSSVVRVRLAAQAVDTRDVFLFHKTTNRAVYERARRPDCDDVVLWNAAGEVTESTTANVVVRVGGRLVTPPVACGLLPGTFRAELLTTGAVVEARVTIEQLANAEALWLVNSVRGWRRAVLVK